MDLLKQYGFLALALVALAVALYFGATGAKGYDLMAAVAAAVFFCGQLVTVNNRIGVLSTSLLAAAINGYLLMGKFESTGFSSCSIDAYWDCGKVNSLPESELFGIPVTLFGLGFYLGLAAASLGNRERTPRFDQVNGLFGILALLFSAYLGFAAFSAGVGCFMCLAIYACAAILFWAALSALRDQSAHLFTDLDKIFGASSLWVVTSIFALTVLVGTSAWRSRVEETTLPDTPTVGEDVDLEKLKSLYKRPAGEVVTDGTEPRLGRPDAPITIVEFADYACPHCAEAAPMLKEILTNRDDVQLLFKAFPLSGACNPVLRQPDVTEYPGVERCKAAMAAECAGTQGRYFDMSNMLFKNLGYNSDEDLAFMAKEVGLDFDAWVQCMQDPSTQQAVSADAMAGASARIEGTPAIFVSGLVEGTWVEMTRGPPGLLALLEAKSIGTVLPAP